MEVDVKEYLRRVKELETISFEQYKIINAIRVTANNVSRVTYIPLKETEQVFANTPEEAGFNMMISLGVIVGIIVGIICRIKYHKWSSFLLGMVISLAIAFVLGWFIGDDTPSKNARIMRENEDIKKKNQETKKTMERKVSNLNNYLNNIEGNYRKTRALLNELYSWNVLHPKYRNFIAVCSLYEYYSTGQCNQLEGHEGAYSRFEQELLLKSIIYKLDIVIEKLDQIQNTQYELYSAIKQSNQNIYRINQNLNLIAQQNNRLENYSEIIAYNSRVAAKNTEIIKWIETFR